MSLHKKIVELKQRSAPILFDSINITKQANLKVDLLDKGIVEGYLVLWNQKSMTGLKFLKGCCARSIKEHGPGSNASYEIKFLNQHNTEDPLSLYELLEEDDNGLHFRTVPLDEWDIQGSSSNRVIKQLRSKTLNNFSHGFNIVWDKAEWDDTDDSIVCAEIQLLEGSVVTIPANLNTRRIQSLEEIGDVQEDIDAFIKTLPSVHRMKARELFTQQHSFIDLTSFQKSAEIVKEDKSNKNVIDYKFLNSNF